MTDDGHWVIAIAHLIQTNKGFFGFFFFYFKIFFCFYFFTKLPIKAI